jgi:hypothetical protein
MRLPLQKCEPPALVETRLAECLGLPAPGQASVFECLPGQTQLQLPFQQFQKGEYLLAKIDEMRDYRTCMAGADQFESMAKPGDRELGQRFVATSHDAVAAGLSCGGLQTRTGQTEQDAADPCRSTGVLATPILTDRLSRLPMYRNVGDRKRFPQAIRKGLAGRVGGAWRNHQPVRCRNSGRGCLPCAPFAPECWPRRFCNSLATSSPCSLRSAPKRSKPMIRMLSRAIVPERPAPGPVPPALRCVGESVIRLTGC